MVVFEAKSGCAVVDTDFLGLLFGGAYCCRVACFVRNKIQTANYLRG
jgi:hypothetical protein